MQGTKLHTQLLEELFGPIGLQVLKQENGLRLVHLIDKGKVSRTLGIVRFKNTDHPLVEAAHTRILAGALLGRTLLDFKIPYSKSLLSQFDVLLPEWIRREFMSDHEEALANYSRIEIEDRSNQIVFLYAELFEVIPMEITRVAPIRRNPPLRQQLIDEDGKCLLSLAGITLALNDSEL